MERQTKIKLCGMMEETDISICNEIRPDYVGFVFYEKSHRNLSKEKAKAFREKLNPDIKTVGVFVDTPMDEILDLYHEGIIDVVQLHGENSPEDIKKLQKEGIFVISASQPQTLKDKLENSPADMILLDPGKGDGKAFDWKILEGIKRPFFLAGGLNPDNVTEAIRQLNPYGVDVSSGIETDKKKDPKKMRAFVEAARNIR